MSYFRIQGGATLQGVIPVYGSKNAALPLFAAALLTPEPVIIHNIPGIADIARMRDIVAAMGVTTTFADGILTIQADTINTDNLPDSIIKSLRGSILLLGALLGRQGRVRLAYPGGDVIGARPIDAHIDGFRQLGAVVSAEDQTSITIDGSALKAGTVVLREFSVTATENMLLVAALLPGKTTIHIAAAEPHVVALAELLNAMGANILGAGTHTITVQGVKKLHGATFRNIPDMLEAGLFILMGAATKSSLTVTGVPTADLLLFFKKLDDIGIGYTINTRPDGLADVTVHQGQIKSFKMQSLPHPGIATDLQAPFAVIATQATGSSLIHDPLYEGRFKHVTELQKMGADAVICDPHRVIITGPTLLTGQRIPSLDIRSGATLLLAGMIAQGETIIDQAEIIDRGYANLQGRLQAIGADIERGEDGPDA